MFIYAHQFDKVFNNHYKYLARYNPLQSIVITLVAIINLVCTSFSSEIKLIENEMEIGERAGF